MSDGSQMRKFFPISLLGLVATGVVYLLQVIPLTGIFLMFALAMFWSVVLINGSMIGVVIEALVGRVSAVGLLRRLLDRCGARSFGFERTRPPIRCLQCAGRDRI